MFLAEIANTMDPKKAAFQFNPQTSDPTKRLGLAPLGRIFNAFLVIAIIYQLFVLYHRIQLIDGYAREHSPTTQPSTQYVKKVAHDVQDEGWKKLLPLSEENYGFESLRSPSNLVPLALMLPFFIVVCLLPLGKIYSYVQCRKEELINAKSVRYDSFVREGNEDAPEAKAYRRELNALMNSAVWPNGNFVGWAFLIVMFALLVGAIAPPLLVAVLASGALLAVLKWLSGKANHSGDSKSI